jgi:hypothetical protein
MPPSGCGPAGENPWRVIAATILLSANCISLTGCSAGGAPSFTIVGAFFPAWLLCGLIGVAGAGAARSAFVATGLSDRLPYQLFVCAAVGVIAATLTWLICFGA